MKILLVRVVIVAPVVLGTSWTTRKFLFGRSERSVGVPHARMVLTLPHNCFNFTHQKGIPIIPKWKIRNLHMTGITTGWKIQEETPRGPCSHHGPRKIWGPVGLQCSADGVPPGAKVQVGAETHGGDAWIYYRWRQRFGAMGIYLSIYLSIYIYIIYIIYVYVYIYIHVSVCVFMLPRKNGEPVGAAKIVGTTWMLVKVCLLDRDLSGFT